MGLIEKDEFICLDCETTGLDTKTDKIIEIAAVRFTFDRIIAEFETLINPKAPIPQISQDIHNISEEMVQDKPTIDQILPDFLKFIGNTTIVGHAVPFDIAIIRQQAALHLIPCLINKTPFIDTLRLARLYGQSPVNSLESLRKHFNIAFEGTHRAMGDVIVNIEVFKYLAKSFKTTESLIKRLEKPICLKIMPLGKHKGRKFSEIPLTYLVRSLKRKFDRDLTYTIKTEIQNRKKGNSFEQVCNPFQSL